MAIVKMKRLRLLAMRSDRESLLKLLQKLGCVEIREPAIDLNDPAWSTLAKPDGRGLSQAKEQSNSINNALATLKKYAPPKGELFRARPELTEKDFFDDDVYASGLDVAQKILEGERQLSALQTEHSKLETQQAALSPWVPLDVPLELSGGDNLSVIFGTIPAKAEYAALENAVASASDLAQLTFASADRDLQYFLLLCHVSAEEACLEAMKPFGFSRATVKGWTGTAADNIRAMDNQLAVLDEQIVQAKEHIASFAPQRELLRRCTDRATQEISREEAKGHLVDTASVFFLEGWMPAKKEEELEAILSPYVHASELTDPEKGDVVPTKLDNPKWMQCINMVTEMYSLPAYDGIDPNPLIFFSYVFFFGFMFADVAYGIIIFAICQLVISKCKPKGYMFYLGRYLGISTAICGIFVGGFFGNGLEVLYDTFLQMEMPGWMQTFCNGIIVNPVTDPMKVLIIAMVIGAIQLLFGQLVHIYMGFRDGTGVDALLDVVPWWIVFVGIAVIALAGNPWVLVAGFLVLLLTQGRHADTFIGKFFGGISSWYDITSWLSDILSYARLMALMLATSVIAQVFNTLGSLGGRSVIGVIMFIVVFLIGHAFNIGVNIIGTYVHAARLHYLEFFGKFYKEGGIPFRPLQYNTKFYDIINKEEQ
jgi:V/A-type H+-transporting ATPase subunit I